MRRSPTPYLFISRLTFLALNSIFIELAEQYKVLDACGNVAKRNVLAEHLKEIIDTLEQKADQIAALYSLLSFKDRDLNADEVRERTGERERKAFKSVRDMLREARKSAAAGGEGTR